MKTRLEKKWAGFFMGMTLVVALSGCNQRRTISPDPTASDSPTAVDDGANGDFPIEVQLAGDDPGVPSSSSQPIMDSSGGNAGDVYSDGGLTVQWFKHLPFPKGPDSPEVFFVLPGHAFGREVSGVTYTPAVLSDENNIATQVQSVNAINTDGSWAIPLFKSFGSSLDVADTAVIHVRLQFDQGQGKNIDIRFTIQEDLPKANQVVFPQSLETSQLPGPQARQWSQETYKNPTDRPLKLWFRYLDSTVMLNQKVLVPGPDQSKLLEVSNSQVSLDRVSIQLGGGSPVELGKGTWMTYTLKPGEVMLSSWFVQPDSQVRICPAAGHSPALEVRLDGGLDREVMLTEANIDPETIQPGDGTWEELVSLTPLQSAPKPTPLYSCQGIF